MPQFPTPTLPTTFTGWIPVAAGVFFKVIDRIFYKRIRRFRRRR